MAGSMFVALYEQVSNIAKQERPHVAEIARLENEVGAAFRSGGLAPSEYMHMDDLLLAARKRTR